MFNFLVKAGVAGVVGAVAVGVIRRFELDKKLMEVATPLIDKALTAMVNFGDVSLNEPAPTSPAPAEPRNYDSGPGSWHQS